MSQATEHPYGAFERAGWARAAAAYADSFEHATSLFASALLDAVAAGKSTQLLDVACGTGALSALAAGLGAQTTGVDFSPQMVAQARQRHPALRFAEADAQALPFADHRFDAVVVNFGIHHFPFPVQALREARRVLRPGGRMAFTVWANPQEHGLHKLTLGALEAAGVSGAALPVSPGGAINEVATCLALLAEAGFAEPLHTQKCSADLSLDSDQELVDMLIHGTVRLSTLIRSQPADKADAVLREIRHAAASFRVAGRLQIPVTAILAAGSR